MPPPLKEPGPTPDAPLSTAAPAAAASAEPGASGSWFANLWEQTQQNTQTTVRFFEAGPGLRRPLSTSTSACAVAGVVHGADGGRRLVPPPSPNYSSRNTCALQER
jgi:hypothetical protein